MRNTSENSSSLGDEEIHLYGLPISDGIAIGFPCFFHALHEQLIPAFRVDKEGIEQEVVRYQQAICNSNRELSELYTKLTSDECEDAASIVASHIEILKDPLMNQHIEDQIRKRKLNAAFVFRSSIRQYEERIGNSSPVIRQRLNDILDLSKRVLTYLLAETAKDTSKKNIIFAERISLSELSKSKSTALVTRSCGQNSHIALIAKSRGIPMVADIAIEPLKKKTITCAIVDGFAGHVILNPEESTYRRYERLQNVEREESLDPQTVSTFDGMPIALLSTLNHLSDLRNLGPEGVGLVRTELLLIHDEKLFFDEEKQMQIYRDLFIAVAEREVTVRLIDIGGDKQMLHFPELSSQANPCLGVKGMRFLLEKPKILSTQLRALLRAAQGKSVSILLPLVTDAEELQEGLSMIASVEQELHSAGWSGAQLRVGCMLELPSALLMSDSMLDKCDFVSLGMNDLAQYTLALDRSNPDLAPAPSHPSLLRLLKMVSVACCERSLPLCLCGEVATSVKLIPLLIGLGIFQFSCISKEIPTLQRLVRVVSLTKAIALAEEALMMTTAAEVDDLLDREYDELCSLL